MPHSTKVDPCGLYRVRSIVRHPKNTGPVLFDVSVRSWWYGVARGLFPTPVHINGVPYWRGQELLECAERLWKGTALAGAGGGIAA